MSNIVIPVAGFGSYPDGRLRAGPFPLRDVGALNRKLEAYGIRPAAPGDTGFVSQTAEGVTISAAGAGVRGYFLDNEELEADRGDLDAFLLDVLNQGCAIHIDGHWSPDPERTIISSATALHLGDRISWSERRDIHHSDGSILQILPRPGEAPCLSLVI